MSMTLHETRRTDAGEILDWSLLIQNIDENSALRQPVDCLHGYTGAIQHIVLKQYYFNLNKI